MSKDVLAKNTATQWLIYRVSRLNPESGEIGQGMVRQLIELARLAAEEQQEPSSQPNK